jgi:phosphonate transport system ATP-binding protein
MTPTLEVDILHIHSLTKRFADKTAVDEASIQVDHSTMIGIIGQPGAENPTLLPALSRLSDASDGNISF